MLKKIILITCIFTSVLFLASSCSTDTNKKKADVEKEDKEVTRSSVDYKVQYRKICDSVDISVISSIQDIDSDTVTADEFEDAYKPVEDEFNRIQDKFNDLEVPSKYKDDWEEYLKLAEDQQDYLRDIIDTTIEIIELRDEIPAVQASNDLARLKDIESELVALGEDIATLTEQRDKSSDDQKIIKDKLGLGTCVDN